MSLGVPAGPTGGGAAGAAGQGCYSAAHPQTSLSAKMMMALMVLDPAGGEAAEAAEGSVKHSPTVSSRRLSRPKTMIPSQPAVSNRVGTVVVAAA